MFFTTTVYLITTLLAAESDFAVLLKNRKSRINIIYFLMSADFASFPMYPNNGIPIKREMTMREMITGFFLNEIMLLFG